MNSESVLYISVAMVLSCFILTVGFSSCEGNMSSFERHMKQCLEVQKDYEKCTKLVEGLLKK